MTDTPSEARIETRIERGIEWYTVDAGPLDRDLTEDCCCARCGSDASFLDCWNCDHGWVERDIGDDCGEELIDVRCEYCDGRGGRWHCISSPEWCEAHPIDGRAHIESTALNSEAWND